MRFEPTRIDGAFLVRLDRHEDERGYFARAHSRAEFEERGLVGDFPHSNLSLNRRRGTLRGLHFQLPPHVEVKLVRCVRGSIYDVVVDLRPDSPTYRRWEAFELSAANGDALYVPAGCGHGFQTLEDESEVLYQISGAYAPDAARGVRYDDPAFGIEWPPAEHRVVVERDRTWPDFAEDAFPLEGLRVTSG